jgi:NADH:ubiquinone oxidoreductase subunit D
MPERRDGQTTLPGGHMPDLKMGTYTINFGPQHPAAHGVLRLIL